MSSFDYERNRWNDEVDTEAARLVREGTPPYEAASRAESIVRLRRQQRALRGDREARAVNAGSVESE